MNSLLLTFALLAQSGDDLHDVYREDAKQYTFYREDQKAKPLGLLEKPIMRWSSDNDWSGDVFVWTDRGRPEVVGCILSGPNGERRNVYHEFHLLSSQLILPVDMLTKRRWAPESGLKVEPVPHAPEPAATAAGRLTQMRQLAKEFSGHMEASGSWELRLLPQPLYRWGKEDEEGRDGALFGYVWTTGTDLELMLLLETRKTNDGLQWHFSPVRMSNRALWLRHGDREIWRVESHQEPNNTSSNLIYTTAYAKTIPKLAPKETLDSNAGGKNESK